MKQNQSKGIILIILSALLFGSYGVWSRLIGTDFGVFYQGWTRALPISIIMFPLLYFRKEIIKIEKEDYKWFSIYLIFTSLTQAPIFYAFNHMDIGTATLLFFVSMLLTMSVVGFTFLGEKLTKLKTIAFILAIMGLMTVFSISLESFAFLAAFMAILNGVASGGEVSISKKLTGSYSALYLTWLSWIIIAITNAPLSIILGEIQHLPSFDIVWLYQLGFAISATFAFWFVLEGLRYVEASVGGLLGLLEIVFSLLFGMLLFHEQLTLKTSLGASLVLLAAALPPIHSLHNKRKRKNIP